MNNREQAKRLMIHYFALIAKKAGVNWSGDCAGEIEEMVDCMIDAAKEETQQEYAMAEGVREDGDGPLF